jgi:hypothetical protein
MSDKQLCEIYCFIIFSENRIDDNRHIFNNRNFEKTFVS